MRVLSICHDHPDFVPAGTEIFAKALTEALGEMPEVEADFLAATSSLTRPQSTAGHLELLGQDYLLRIGAYDRFTMERLDGSDWTETLSDLIAENKYQIVHFHGLDRIGASTLTLMRRRFPELVIALTLHDYQLICANDGLMLRTQDNALCQHPSPDACRRCFPEISLTKHLLRSTHLKMVLSQVDIFVAPSRYIEKAGIDWGLPPEKIHHIPNAATSDLKKSSVKATEPRNRFGYFGNLGPHKGVSVLIDASKRLAEANADIGVDIHGDQPFADQATREAFQIECASAGPVIQYLGPYTREDLASRMATVDWVVLPALWPENAPLTVLEAQMSGKPVICTPVGGLPELVQHGVNGLHVPRGDARRLAETLLRAATEPGLWESLAGNIKTGLNLSHIAKRYWSLFQSHFSEERA